LTETRTDDPLGIHDHGGAEGDTHVVLEHAEGPADLVAGVGQHGVRDLLGEGLAVGEPGLVREEGVGAGADHRDAVILEVLDEVLESADLGGTHEGEVQRVPVEDVPLALEVLV
jgi:hypothetical protein